MSEESTKKVNMLMGKKNETQLVVKQFFCCSFSKHKRPLTRGKFPTWSGFVFSEYLLVK